MIILSAEFSHSLGQKRTVDRLSSYLGMGLTTIGPLLVDRTRTQLVRLAQPLFAAGEL